ncbi:MAG TPA: dienelactone hydrolase family protein [Caulobacteraceae bacterium]|jgi:carboxymethylenebutenolidase|nr:dienelactone hydrolase family protein [Caulobacteraceae bacterium]
MIERTVDIPTSDGATTTFVCHPGRGGPHPLIIFYMDAPGIREELRDMVRRLASVGYYVLLPNLYYRAGVVEPPDRERMFELMNGLSIAMVMEDTDALLAWVDGRADASKGSAGAVGYCMSGQFAINAAARHPGRFAAAASIYGVRLVTDLADSPHRMAAKARAELYFACAERDHWAPLPMVQALAAAVADPAIEAEVEIYPGVEHGFAFPGRAAFNRDAAERHWERLFALFARRLHP